MSETKRDGRQQGELLRDLIQQRWEEDVHPILAKLQAQNPGVTARVAKAHARTLANMKSAAPDLIEEIDSPSKQREQGIHENRWLYAVRAEYSTGLDHHLGRAPFTVQQGTVDRRRIAGGEKFPEMETIASPTHIQPFCL